MTRHGIGEQSYQMTDTVLYRLVQLAKIHRNELARELAKLGMYIGQEQVLLNLWEADGVSQAELGARVQVLPPTLTKMLQRMERSGLVRRERTGTRGRASWVYLTDRGWQLRGEVEALWRHAECALTAGLDEDELSVLHGYLARLKGLESALETADFGPDRGVDLD